jgi:hypothetical protein
MYAQLFANGELYDQAEKAAEQARQEYHAGITNGMLPHESWEGVRENHIFLPAEYDVPNLGETARGGSEPEQEETATGESFELYKELCDLNQRAFTESLEARRRTASIRSSSLSQKLVPISTETATIKGTRKSRKREST